MILKMDYDTGKLQKVTYDYFNDVIKITPPKIHHQNDVIKIFHSFLSPSLSKILVALLLTSLQPREKQAH